jgi:hypothetical protein
VYHESNTVHIMRMRTITCLGRAPLERWGEGASCDGEHGFMSPSRIHHGSILRRSGLRIFKQLKNQSQMAVLILKSKYSVLFAVPSEECTANFQAIIAK